MQNLLATTLFVLISSTLVLASAPAQEHENDEVKHLSRQKRQLLILCEKAGFIPYPDDTTKYIQCVFIGTRWYYYVYNCPPAANFDPARGLCVIGGGGAPTTMAPTTAAPTTVAVTTGAGTTGAPTTVAGTGTTAAGGSTEAPTTAAGGTTLAPTTGASDATTVANTATTEATTTVETTTTA